MFFLLPGVGEILRVNGSVAGCRGAQTSVEIEEAFVHCAQAVLRSRLWTPGALVDRDAVPDLMALAGKHLAASSSPSSPISTVVRSGERIRLRRRPAALDWRSPSNTLRADDSPRMSIEVCASAIDSRSTDRRARPGLPMPYSCTVGNCGDCMVRLRSGEVTQSEPNCLTPQQKADGFILACVGCPLSKTTLEITEL